MRIFGNTARMTSSNAPAHEVFHPFPQVLEGAGLDPQIHTGFSFGIGPERITMLKNGIEDIHLSWSNPLRFLSRFQPQCYTTDSITRRCRRNRRNEERRRLCDA